MLITNVVLFTLDSCILQIIL